MGAPSPGAIGIMPGQGDLYLEVCHFFQKNMSLGEDGGYLQAFRLKEHLDGGYQVSFGNICVPAACAWC